MRRSAVDQTALRHTRIMEHNVVLPADINIVTVTGTYLDEYGLPETGSVTFLPSVTTIRDPANDSVMKLGQKRVVLDSAGSFSADLIATDDPDIIPVGWY